jgi:hypothetical protein
MTYKKKLKVLSAIIVVLALAYILGIIFEPERRISRSASFFWLDSGAAKQVDKITMIIMDETLALSRKNNKWYVSFGGNDYPAKQLRAEDFLSLFTRRAPYPVRSTNPSSLERLGLDDASAFRIIFSGGAAPAFLDLLIGSGDIMGKEVYMRKYGQNEVRSGEDIFTAYISSSRGSWYNLRLFPETEDGKLDVDAVQRITVYRQTGDSASQIFTRNGNGWIMNALAQAELDTGKIDSYVWTVLYAEGDNFVDTVGSDDPVLNDSRIVLELGTGEIKSIRLSAPDETGRRMAVVSGSDMVYSLAGWMVDRFFYDTAYFKR